MQGRLSLCLSLEAVFISEVIAGSYCKHAGNGTSYRDGTHEAIQRAKLECAYRPTLHNLQSPL